MRSSNKLSQKPIGLNAAKKQRGARAQHFAYKEKVSPGIGPVVTAESDQVKTVAVPKQKVFVTVDSSVSTKIDFSTDAIIFVADF